MNATRTPATIDADTANQLLDLAQEGVKLLAKVAHILIETRKRTTATVDR